MNAPHPLTHLSAAATAVPIHPQPRPPADHDGIDLAEYWDTLMDSRWLIAITAALALAVGACYAVFATPVYKTSLLIQVEENVSSAKGLHGQAGEVFDMKTGAAPELELLRSRMVIAPAVENTRLYLKAKPRTLPVVGDWLSRRATGLSEPRFGGYVYGREKIQVAAMDVPTALEGSSFTLVAQGNGTFSLSHPELGPLADGKIGVPLAVETARGPVRLHVAELEAKPGAHFDIARMAPLAVVQDLQASLLVSERGRQSGLIEASLQGTDPVQLARLLNEIGGLYVKQNVERKGGEAQKTLAFLNQQLQELKQELARSEEAYTRFRNQRGTVSLQEEARLLLATMADRQSKLLEAQQKRREGQFGDRHPAVQALDEQIGGLTREINNLNARIRTVPRVEQDTQRLEREFKLKSELYSQLQSNALQLQLMREGKMGNVRMIDTAAVPRAPIQPRKNRVLAVSLGLGLLAGLALAFGRNAWSRGIRNAQEIESHTGLNVYGTIPRSERERAISRKAAKQRRVTLLAKTAPEDPAVESLRSLRPALQIAMMEAPNNLLLITSSDRGVGKSFVSANLAAVLAAAGNRVLLIDGDLRKGRLHEYFGLARANGLSELLTGSVEVHEAIRPNVLPNLDFMPTGALPKQPGDWLMSRQFAEQLDALRFARYDAVIMDSAPIRDNGDTIAAATLAGTLLLVARAGQSQLGDLHETVRRLALTRTAPAGVLFNAVDSSRRTYRPYGYKYSGPGIPYAYPPTVQLRRIDGALPAVREDVWTT